MAKQFNQGDLPMKYRMTYTPRGGKQVSEFVTMVPDPKDTEKVREHLIETRGDLFNAGVTFETLRVETVGPMSAEDRARMSRAMSGVTGPGLDPLTAPVTPQTVIFEGKK